MHEPAPTLPSVIVRLHGIAFIALGVAFLARPTEMIAMVDIEATTALARGDIRAVYGGMEVGLGVALLLARGSQALAFAARALVLLFACMVAARAGSFLADGVPADPGPLLLAVEIGGLVTAALAARGLQRP